MNPVSRWLARRRADRELAEEMAAHIEEIVQTLIEQGQSEEEARRNARRRFGNTTQLKENSREVWGWSGVEQVIQDVRFGCRMLAKTPGFTVTAIAVLAVGIGVNTAIFSIANAKIIKPLPFRDPSRLVSVWDTYLPQFSKVGISPSELQVWQSQKDLFQGTAWYRYVPLDGNLSAPGSEPIAVHADFVSANLFPLLGISPLAGRTFGTAEDPWSVLISEHMWRNHFDGNPEIIGKTIRFNDRPLTIVGVIPAATQFPSWADLWLPSGPLLGDQLTNPIRHALGFIARLQPSVNEKQVSSRLNTLSRGLAKEHRRTSTGWGIRVRGLHADLTENVRPALLLLLCAASFLLLVGCANIASLLLSRASVRAKEIAVRIALGASALRIVRQLLTESLILALLGGLAGLVIAKAALDIAVPAHTHIEPAVILFLFLTSLAAGALFGLAPAAQSLRIDTQSALKAGATTSSGTNTRSALVIFEIALTTMLVIGAGILTKSFVRLMNVDPGFNPKGVLTLRILAPSSQRPELLFHRIEQKLLSIPGIQKVAATNTLPLIADRADALRFNVPGSPLINPDALPGAQIRTASPDYFNAMQISLKAGRVFTERDLNRPVVIINETMAKRFWPKRDPVGIKFIDGPWGPNPHWATIIGVVANVKQFGLASEPSFDVYYPSVLGQYLIIKAGSDSLRLKRVIRKTIRSVDPELAISEMRSMDEIATVSARTRRWTMALLVTFASIAFLLALIGIFGVTSWSVTQKTREIGIRMALGAESCQVLLLFVRYGFKLTLLGLTCGIIASFALRRALANLVYGVSTGDPLIYGSVSAFMFVIALLACYIPARKATKVDPLISLRYE